MVKHNRSERTAGSPRRLSRPRFGRIAIAAVAAVVVATAPVAAQRGGIPTARDAETEALLRDYLQPLVRAAGVPMPKVNLVTSPDYNAFVTPGNRLFINSGTIIQSESPNEVIGVLAHELAHLANNDNAQIQQVIEDTSNAMLLAGLLSVGAAAIGSAAGSEEAASIGSGVFSGLGSLGTRVILRYRREQEAAADRGAVRYLDATGQSAAGMIASMERLASQNLFVTQRANPYLQSHPFPRDRAETISSLARRSANFGRRDPEGLRIRHNLVRAKLAAFTMSQGAIYRTFPLSDQSLPARYARAITEYRSGRPAEALRMIDQLIASQPSNPYFHELKGQALLEGGNPKASIAPLRKAVSMSDNPGLINIMLGQALISVGGEQNAREAVAVLRIGLQEAPRAVNGYRLLARAYAMVDDVPMAQLTTAEGLMVQGQLGEAKAQARRAQAKLKRGTPAWVRADEILSYNPPR